MTDKPKPSETPGMSEASPKFVDEAKATLAASTSSANELDDLLTALAVDYYAAYIARDAATDAREEVEHQAEKSDSEAIRIEGVPHTSGGPDRLFLPFLFDSAGTLTPSREQVSQYCDTDDLTEAVMRHLEKYGERCVAALEAAGWPEKYAKHERIEQRMDALFDQMVQTPAQGFRGIAAKVRGLVYPHEWGFLHDGKLDDFDDQINTEMLASLVADVERLSKGGASIGEASAIEDPVLMLKREWEARYKALDRQRDTGDDSDEARQPFFDRLRETEVQILRTQATTPAGIAIKLILWARLHCTADEVSGLSWTRKSIDGHPHDLDRLPVMSALLDLECMSSGIVIETPPVPKIDEPLLALERRWREAAKAHEAAGIDTEEDRLTEAIEAQHKIVGTPARSIAGVLVKLNIYASCQPRADTHPIDQLSPDSLDLDQAAVAGAIRDLKRLDRTTTVAEAPPAEDAALFDALAEYDRLAAISQDLERRKEVFRPGIPEAEEANKAYEAAYDEAMKAWATARDIPATTQVGLFAKLQETVRFMADLGEDELYEAEWNVIKADVQRIAG